MGAEFLFMDDNARPHRANIVDECLQSEDITRMDCPAYSPDLNPIEHVWDMLGRRIAARQPPPTCLPELRRALLDEWCNIPHDQIDNLIRSMPRRCAYNELIDIDWSEVSQYAEMRRITWKFIPPTAALWGGFWERLVRTVKELLRRTLGKAILTYEELLTILCECEKVVNSRPLTYLSEDMQDVTLITPARVLFKIPTADTKNLDVRDTNHFRKIEI
ncbi:integrase catalytic domain-containing protein [Trichonephila clavipes]|nr:integrase catalytic domain-containing protein [Trichonephila clavipes]